MGGGSCVEKHTIAEESLRVQQPASTEASAQSTGVTNMLNPALAGGRSPDDCLNQ